MWEERWSKTKSLVYYLNTQTKESQWEEPSPDQEILPLPAAQKPIRCAHILVKHRDSRRPASHRNNEITITVQEASDKITRLRLEITGNAASTLAIEVARVAKLESDCSSFAKGGDLGLFVRGQMQPAFETAAFALEVGELSELVSSDSGIHLIYRLA